MSAYYGGPIVDTTPAHRRIPPPRQLVSEHPKDDDLRWLNDQLERAELPPVLIRRPQDIPVPPPPAGRPIMAALGWCAPSEVDAACTCYTSTNYGLHWSTCKSLAVRHIAPGPAGAS